MKMELLFFVFLFCSVFGSSGLNSDGLVLMKFKSSVLVDPLSLLQNWNDTQETPCSWRGVSCNNESQVVSLSLPNSKLLGSVSSDLGLLQSLQILDLSNNSFNGPLPESFFNSKELRFLDLSSNMISGELSSSLGDLHNLVTLNLSDNALAGKLPPNMVTLSNLTVVSLENNYFSGEIPGGWRVVEFLDLSSNLINGSLPPDFRGDSLRFLNVSFNQISGEIPPEIGVNFPRSVILDLSFNNLTGLIPDSPVFLNQKSSFYAGNPGLCGEPTRTPCLIPSSPSVVPDSADVPTSTPAIAAIPNTIGSSPVKDPQSQRTKPNPKTGLRPGVIIGIVIGDITGIGILAAVFFYIYKCKKNKKDDDNNNNKNKPRQEADTMTLSPSSSSSSSQESTRFKKWSCLRNDPETTPSEEDEEEDEEKGYNANQRLVIVDGEKEMEIETLLKASAYILGATGSSIMYKAVLEDGSVFAVRRLGENGLNQRRFKDFESHIRAIGKLVHPNLVRLRGFYWGTDEKLVIYDFVPNGSLVNPRYRKGGASPSPYHLPWETRLKIAKGIARGLTYLHEKKHVHGNLKPSNILLGHDMEPKIGDFGLERLLSGETSYIRASGSSRIFSSKRSTMSSRDFSFSGPTPSPSPSSIGPISPYCAPESFRSLKPNSKWDVFSFGVILLELLTGKIVSTEEIGLGNGLTIEDGHRALRMADIAIRNELEGKEDFLLSCFKLGYNCASSIPQKRPTMKESLAVLDRFPLNSPAAKSPSFHYAHYQN